MYYKSKVAIPFPETPTGVNGNLKNESSLYDIRTDKKFIRHLGKFKFHVPIQSKNGVEDTVYHGSDKKLQMALNADLVLLSLLLTFRDKKINDWIKGGILSNSEEAFTEYEKNHTSAKPYDVLLATMQAASDKQFLANLHTIVSSAKRIVEQDKNKKDVSYDDLLNKTVAVFLRTKRDLMRNNFKNTKQETSLEFDDGSEKPLASYDDEIVDSYVTENGEVKALNVFDYYQHKINSYDPVSMDPILSLIASSEDQSELKQFTRAHIPDFLSEIGNFASSLNEVSERDKSFLEFKDFAKAWVKAASESDFYDETYPKELKVFREKYLGTEYKVKSTHKLQAFAVLTKFLLAFELSKDDRLEL